MPTGYTADIYEGNDITFPDFVLKCARAFGATITMRDEPLDAPIPEKFEPYSHHAEYVATAEQEKAEILSWTDEQLERKAAEDYAERHKYWEETKVQKEALKERYDRMLTWVYAWVAPTEEHQGLKEFMIEQLTSSIEHDCSMKYWDEPQPTPPQEFREQRLERAERDIEYYSQRQVEEAERAEGRTNWVRQLRNSLSVYEGLS